MTTQAWKEEDVDEVLAGTSEVRSSVPQLKLLSGADGNYRRNRLRIGPPRADSPHGKWYHWVALHYVNQRPIPCVEFHQHRFCQICALSAEFRRNGKKEQADQIQAKYYALMNAVKLIPDGRAVKVSDEGIVTDEPQRVEVLHLTNNTMLDLRNEIDSLSGSKVISSPQNGRNVIIKRKGTTQRDTRYVVEIDEPTPFNNGDFSIWDKLYDLTSIYPILEDDMVKSLLSAKPEPKQLPVGVTWEEDEEPAERVKATDAVYRVVEEDEEPATPQPKPKKREPVVDTDAAEAAKLRLQALRAKPVVEEEEEAPFEVEEEEE